MTDLVQSVDFGNIIHISKKYNELDYKAEFKDLSLSEKDLIRKIHHFSYSLSEREFELSLSKPLLPEGFRSHSSQYDQLPPKVSAHSIVEQKQLTVMNSEGDKSKSAVDEIIARAEIVANTAYSISELQDAVKDFYSNLPSQKVSGPPLFYDDHESADILWINDAVTFDERHIQQIASDISGQMIVKLFEHLGYYRQKLSSHKTIGFTALSFWPRQNISQEYEFQICFPFVKRLIYLMDPKYIFSSGYVPKKYFNLGTSICDQNSMNQLKILDKEFKVFSVTSLAQILNSDIAKKLFWFDLLTIMNHNR